MNNIGRVRKTEEKQHSGLKVYAILLTLVCIILLGYIFTAGRQDNKQINVNQDNINEQLSDIILLPEEKPSIAVLEDVQPLLEINPVFYANAQNGDKLIVYSRFAMIFRESEGKIINIIQVENE